MINVNGLQLTLLLGLPSFSANTPRSSAAMGVPSTSSDQASGNKSDDTSSRVMMDVDSEGPVGKLWNPTLGLSDMELEQWEQDGKVQIILNMPMLRVY
jgi:hypothetical protein